MDIDQFLNAIKNGDVTTAEQLLEADPTLANAQTPQGISTVLWTLYVGQRALAHKLAKGRSNLSIFEAPALGDMAQIKRLLETDPAQVNAVAPDGFQPLGLAAYFGNVDVARYLIEAGANIDAPAHNSQQVRPLHSAAAGRHHSIVQLLLTHGADVNATQNGGFTALHSAAQNGQADMVELLLAHGARVDQTTDDGRTATDFAREEGHQEVVSLLAGA